MQSIPKNTHSKEREKQGVGLALGLIGLFGACFAAAELWSEASGSRIAHLVTKPFIMVFVAAYFFLSTQHLALGAQRAKIRVQIFAGLGCSWLGDVALMFTASASWVVLVGMGAFAFAHAAYILAFRAGDGRSFLRQARVHYAVALLLFAYGVALFSILAQYVAPEMKIPIAGYAVILLSMAFAAFVRRQYAASESFAWALAGALAFVASDSILAWHLFVQPNAALAVALMALYIFAQSAIVVGMSKEIRRAPRD